MASEPEPLDKGQSASAPQAQGDAKPAPPKLKGPRPLLKYWNAPPPDPHFKRVFWLLIVLGALCLAGLALVIGYFAMPGTVDDTVALGPEFTDHKNNVTIRPPLNWSVNDPHDGWNVYIKGPAEKSFSPLVILSLEVSPGKLNSYLIEHKTRIEHENKTVKWLSDDDIGTFDGCRARRLEFDCDLTDNSGRPVKVRTLQYVMEDWPRFYRVTCDVAADKYQKYLARFEACAKSFKRILPKPESNLAPDVFKK